MQPLPPADQPAWRRASGKSTLSRVRDGLLGRTGESQRLQVLETSNASEPGGLGSGDDADDHEQPLGSLVNDAWNIPAPPPTMPLVYEARVAQYKDAAETSKDVLLRSEMDAERLRQQMSAVQLERDDLNRRVMQLQQRAGLEGDLRESLKAEFRSGIGQLHQQLSETTLRIVGEVKALLNVESQRLQHVFSQISALEFSRVLETIKRSHLESKVAAQESKTVFDSPHVLSALSEIKNFIAKADSQGVGPALEKINANLARLSGALHDIQNSKVEVDFSVVLRAIRDSQTKIDFSQVLQAIQDTRASVEMSPVQQVIQDHKAEIERHFSHVCKLIRESQTSLDLSPVLKALHESKTNENSGQDKSVRRAIQEHKAQMESSFGELRKDIAMAKADVDVSPVIEAVQSVTTTLSELQRQMDASVGELAASTHQKLEPGVSNILRNIHQYKLEMDAGFVQLDQAIKQNNNEVELAALWKAFNDHSSGMNSFISQMSQSTTARDARVHESFEKHASDVSSCVARLHGVMQEQKLAFDLSPVHRVLQDHRAETHDYLARLHQSVSQSQGDAGIQQMHRILRDMNVAMSASFEELTGHINDKRTEVPASRTHEMVQQLHEEMKDSLSQVRADLARRNSESDLLPLHDAINNHSGDMNKSFEQLHDAFQRSKSEIDLRPVHDAIQIQKGEMSEYFALMQQAIQQMKNDVDLTPLREEIGEEFGQVHAVMEQNRVDLTPLHSAFEEHRALLDDHMQKVHVSVQQGVAGVDLDPLHRAVQDQRADVGLLANKINMACQRIVDQNTSLLEKTQLDFDSLHRAKTEDIPRMLEEFKSEITRTMDRGQVHLLPIQAAVESVGKDMREASQFNVSTVLRAIQDLKSEVDLTSVQDAIRENRVDKDMLLAVEKCRECLHADVLNAALSIEQLREEMRVQIALLSSTGSPRRGRAQTTPEMSQITPENSPSFNVDLQAIGGRQPPSDSELEADEISFPSASFRDAAAHDNAVRRHHATTLSDKTVVDLDALSRLDEPDLLSLSVSSAQHPEWNSKTSIGSTF